MAGYARGRDAAKLGTLTVAAVIGFSVLFLKMTDRGLSLGQWDVHVRVPAADGLRKRDPVLYRGVNVGEVKSLVFTPAGDVLVQVRLKQRIPLSRDAGAELAALDMFGRQSLVLRDGGEDSALLQDGDTIRAARPVSMPARVSQLADRGEALLSDSTLGLLREALAGTRAAGFGVAALTTRLEQLVAAQQQALGGLLAQTTSLAANLHAATNPDELGALRGDLSRAAASLAQLTIRLDTTALAVGEVLGSLRRRQGSAGLLLNDSALYLRTSELLASVDGLVRDIKANPKKYINVSVF